MLRIVVFSVLLISISAAAQVAPYPRGYFRNPLNIPIILAGNFGECRPGHFHSGLDIKTGGHEHEPVYAAADGYVSRIKMEPGGFGHGLYITHPNGYTTLYAHLNDFVPAIQQFVRQQQYAKESWTVDLSLQPDQFPVKQGDQIAWSGNTGGSTAPHLHFEIRDSRTEHPLNPQLFGFEIKDTIAPVFKQLTLYDMELSMYYLYGFNDRAKSYSLRRKGNTYLPVSDSITVRPFGVGLGIVADDYMNGSSNTLAFYTAEWYKDDVLQGRIRLNDIGYDETRYLNAYADYPGKQTKGLWVQCLFQLPGNHLDHIYESLNATHGMINTREMIKVNDTAYHAIRVVLKDVSGNASELSFVLRVMDDISSIGYQNCNQFAQSGQLTAFNEDCVKFHLDESQLYDHVCLNFFKQQNTSMDLSCNISIGPWYVPIHHYFDLSLKATSLLPFSMRSKVVVINKIGKEFGKESGLAATPVERGWYRASVRSLGSYRLAIDTSAPFVYAEAPVKGSLRKAVSITFLATDNLTSVRSFRAELDDNWILFEQHENKWTYVFDEHCPKGKHKLVIKASDENDNISTHTYIFTR